MGFHQLGARTISQTDQGSTAALGDRPKHEWYRSGPPARNRRSEPELCAPSKRRRDELSESPEAQGRPLAWRAVAVGDSCLFQVEQGQVLKAWPITASADFGNTPSLLSSKAANNGDGLAAATVMKAQGTCRHETAFYLMTDALSCWFLREHERGNHPWRLITDLGTDTGPPFGSLVDTLRAAGQIKNDDVTLLRIDILG